MGAKESHVYGKSDDIIIGVLMPWLINHLDKFVGWSTYEFGCCIAKALVK